MTKKEGIQHILTRGVAEVIVKTNLTKRLHAGEKLRVKLGIDPTGPRLHIGHAIPLRKLRQFQDAGHHAVLIIGDFTARIGDPTGKSTARITLTPQEVKKNAKTYLAQAGKILDLSTLEVRYNSEWFDAMDALTFMRLMGKFTVQRVLERDDFTNRLKADEDVFANEILYPVLQGYDSVMVESDLELGGTDQKFNVLFGRRVQRRYQKPKQDIITLKLLTDPTGKKMGKTEGNMISLEEKPAQMYSKVMAWPDTMIAIGMELCTDIPMTDVKKIARAIEKNSMNPRDAKMRLARELVTLYHSADAAKKAEDHFARVIQKKERPDTMPTKKMAAASISLIDALVDAKLESSKSAARRVIAQGGVKVDDRVIDDIDAIIKIPKSGVVIQKGKRHFVKLKRSA